jgi:hypothetical protein
MSKRFGAVRQVAYVVHDIERAMRHWSGVMGVGPFFYLERIAPRGSTFRGQPASLELSLALSQSGPLQIELIQQHNDAPSQFRNLLDRGLEGQHHVAFWTERFDEDLARYLGQGLEVLSTANQAPDRNVFFTVEGHPGSLIELSETSGPKGRFFERIAEIAADWDGRDPVRKVTRMAPEAIGA